MLCLNGVSLVAQMVKSLPAVPETWVLSVGWEDPLEKKMQPTLVFLLGKFYGQRSLVSYSPRDCKGSDTTEQLTHIYTQHSEVCPGQSIKSESESEVAQSCPTLCDPVDCRPPGSCVHGISQARILEWVAISFSRGSS